MNEMLKSAISNMIVLDDSSRPSSSASRSENNKSRSRRSVFKSPFPPQQGASSSPRAANKKPTMRFPGREEPNSAASIGTPTRPKPKDDLPTILNTQRRTLTQAGILYKAIQEFEFLKKFRDENSELNDDEAIIHLCQNLGYEVHEGGSVIFREGDVANEKMYLVFSGEAIIVRRQADFYTLKNIEKADEQEKEKEKEKEKDNPMKGSHRTISKMGSQHIDGNKSLSKMSSQINIESARSAEPSGFLEKQLSPKMATLTNTDNPPSNRVSMYKRIQTSNLFVDTDKTRDDEDEVFDLDKFIKSFGTVVDVMKKGRFFGDKALVSNAPRAASVITGCRSEFLTISASLFKQLKAKFEKTTRNKLNFLMDNFPAMDSVTNQKTVEFLLYIMEEKIYQFHNIIINEDTKGKDIFIINKGSCDVFKKKPNYHESIIPETASQSLHKTHIFVCTIHAGVFFGEEILFKKDQIYDYTIRASSAEVVIYAIEKSKFLLRFPYMSIEGMKTFHQNQKIQFENFYQRGLMGSEMIEKSLKFKQLKSTSTKLLPQIANQYNEIHIEAKDKSRSPDRASENRTLTARNTISTARNQGDRRNSPVENYEVDVLHMLATSKTKDKILRGHAGHLHALDKMYNDELMKPNAPAINKSNIKDKIKKEKFDFGVPEEQTYAHFKKILETPNKKPSQNKLQSSLQEQANNHSSLLKKHSTLQLSKIHKLTPIEYTQTLTGRAKTEKLSKEIADTVTDVTSLKNLKKKINEINFQMTSRRETNLSFSKPLFTTELSSYDTVTKFALPDLSIGRGSEVEMIDIMTTDRGDTSEKDTMEMTQDSKLLFGRNTNGINNYITKSQNRKISNLRTKWINMQKIRFPNSGLGTYLEQIKSTSNVVESIFVADNSKGNTSRSKPSNLGIMGKSDQFRLNKTRSEHAL